MICVIMYSVCCCSVVVLSLLIICLLVYKVIAKKNAVKFLSCVHIPDKINLILSTLYFKYDERRNRGDQDTHTQ